MTLFEFMFPVVALVVALAMAFYMRFAARRLDATNKDHHPAE